MIDETTDTNEVSGQPASAADESVVNETSLETAPSVETADERQAADSAAEIAVAEPETAESFSEGESGGEADEIVDEPEAEAILDDDDEDDEDEDLDAPPIEEVAEADANEIETNWYILKVQSNREDSIRDGLERRVKVAGLEPYFGDIIVPTEDVAEFKNGKKKISKRKLYPGYIVVNMSINDETWFLVRETPGIGDFTGSAGKPTPMLSHEVDRILKASKTEDEGGDEPITAIPFKIDERVRIKEGTFENFEGDVDGIDEANGRVTVMINIFGRSTPVELEHWQIESV